MKRTISAVLAATILGTSVFATAAPAFADGRREHYMDRYYKEHGRDKDYYRWRKDRRHWNDRDYRRWYEGHRRHDDNNDAAAAAIFGLAAGAILGGIAAGSMAPPPRSQATINSDAPPPAGGYRFGSAGYVSYCSSKYRSFDARSGTFMGYDGYRHYCQ